MGHRANFVVIKDGAATIYFDNWAALGCVYLVTEGPESAVSELEDMEQTDELLDWAFCEGGFLIDYDKSLLIVFGEFTDADDFEGDDEGEPEDEDDDGSEPSSDLEKEEADARAFLTQIQPAWPGWTIRWDQRGADAFSEHLRARGFSALATQAPSHPDDCLRIELAPRAN